jgi:hypothetical protein
MRKIAPVRMWAVVVIQKRSEWINWNTIRRTRKEAAEAWLADWIPEYAAKERKKRNKTWRTAPVIVSAEEA